MYSVKTKELHPDSTAVTSFLLAHVKVPLNNPLFSLLQHSHSSKSKQTGLCNVPLIRNNPIKQRKEQNEFTMQRAHQHCPLQCHLSIKQASWDALHTAFPLNTEHCCTHLEVSFQKAVEAANFTRFRLCYNAFGTCLGWIMNLQFLPELHLHDNDKEKLGKEYFCATPH